MYTDEQFETRLRTHLGTSDTEQDIFTAMHESNNMIDQLQQVLAEANIAYIEDPTEDNEDQVAALKRAIGAHEHYHGSLEHTLARKRRMAQLQGYVVPVQQNPTP